MFNVEYAQFSCELDEKDAYEAYGRMVAPASGKLFFSYTETYVIASQCAHWRGNPYSFSLSDDAVSKKGERIATSGFALLAMTPKSTMFSFTCLSAAGRGAQRMLVNCLASVTH